MAGVCLLAPAAPLAWSGGAARAQNADSVERPTPERLEALQKQLEDRKREREALRAAAQQREQEVEALRQRMIEAAQALQQGETRASEVESRLAELTTQADAAQADLDRQMSQLSEVLAALEAMEMSKPPALIVTPEDATDAARAAILLSSAAPALQERAAKLRATLAEVARLKDAMTRERESLSKAESDLRARRSILQELLTQKKKEFDDVSRRAAMAQNEASMLAAQATSLQDVVQRLERLARQAAPRLKPPPPLPPSTPVPSLPARPTDLAEAPPQTPRSAAYSLPAAFSAARGLLPAPVAGRIVGVFGERQFGGGRAEGVRYSTRDDAVVIAPYSGTVVFARAFKPIGNVLILDVGGGYHIVLRGMARFDCVEGQRVAAGEPIAAMARGEQETQLQLEIRKNSEPINPKPWLRPD